jgi:hypothetical protein
MATVYSTQFTRVRGGRKAEPSHSAGVQQVLSWDFVLPAGNIADVLVCGILLKGSRVLGGMENHGALTSGGATATGSYGTYLIASDGITLGAADSAARFLAATSFEAAGNTALATTTALGYGFIATVDVFVVCVNSVEAFATAGVVSGHLTYVKN